MAQILSVMLFLLSGCVIDTIDQVAIFKNASNVPISVATGGLQMGDSELYYSNPIVIRPKSTDTIYGSRKAIGKDRYLHFHIFNNDTITVYLNARKVNGIANSSFLKRIDVLADSLSDSASLVFH